VEVWLIKLIAVKCVSEFNFYRGSAYTCYCHREEFRFLVCSKMLNIFRTFFKS